MAALERKSRAASPTRVTTLLCLACFRIKFKWIGISKEVIAVKIWIDSYWSYLIASKLGRLAGFIMSWPRCEILDPPPHHPHRETNYILLLSWGGELSRIWNIDRKGEVNFPLAIQFGNWTWKGKKPKAFRPWIKYWVNSTHFHCSKHQTLLPPRQKQLHEKDYLAGLDIM